jgi:hypothetical protein
MDRFQFCSNGARRSTPGWRVAAAVFALAIFSALSGRAHAGPAGEGVDSVVAPSEPLPPEEQSRSVTKFSFILYGDDRGLADGFTIQSDHARVVDGALAAIKELQNSKWPVRFVLQTGDAVSQGKVAREWNRSFIPVVDRLVAEGHVPYFMVPGNHDVSSAEPARDPERQAGLRNLLEAMKFQMPPEGSPRRLAGYPTYSFGYGNTFVIGFDSVIANDDTQYVWIKNQLEGLDRRRYVNVFVFCHHPPFSSGPHGNHPDHSIKVMRERYMPLFEAYHVRAVLCGHEHLYDHWVERYTDNQGPHRMDFIISGGGGAPRYPYDGEPDLHEYDRANQGLKVELQHIVKPGSVGDLTPFHFVVLHVEGTHVSLDFHSADPASDFHPYPADHTDLEDPAP